MFTHWNGSMQWLASDPGTCTTHSLQDDGCKWFAGTCELLGPVLCWVYLCASWICRWATACCQPSLPPSPTRPQVLAPPTTNCGHIVKGVVHARLNHNQYWPIYSQYLLPTDDVMTPFLARTRRNRGMPSTLSQVAIWSLLTRTRRLVSSWHR